MKEYKSNEKLLEHLISKNVIVSDKKAALDKIEKYTYYSIINSYKTIFKKSDGSYKDNVTFDEMKYFLNDDDYSILLKEFFAEVNSLKLSLSSVSIDDILNIMGFFKDEFNLNDI